MDSKRSPTDKEEENYLQEDRTSTSVKCSLCSHGATDEAKLDEHTMSHKTNDENPHKCSYCDYRTTRKSSLNRHIRIKHTRQGLVGCDLCAYKAPSKSELDKHMLTHMSYDQRPHKCIHCDYKAIRKCHLDIHMKVKHTRHNLINCDLCSYKAPNRSALNNHMITHMSPDDRPYRCPYCDHTTSQKGNLDRHVRRKHTKEGFFECSLCRFQSPDQCHLDRHMITHMSYDKRPHVCPHCGHRATQKQDLEMHIRIKHTRVGLVKCSLCNYEAASKATLKQHMITHMSPHDRPHHCPHCDYKAAQKCNLNTHLIKKHASDVQHKMRQTRLRRAI